MISGNVGSTRKTLVIIDSRSSASPPRYPADTPTSTASTVAKKPATSAMTSDSRVPYTSCAQMSCPKDVVPSQCSLDGGRPGGNAGRFGSLTSVNHSGAIAKMQKIVKRTSPIIALRLRNAARNSPPPRRRVGVGADGAAFEVSTRRAVTISPLAPGARVQPGDGEVAGEHG